MIDFDRQVSQALRASGWTVQRTAFDGELLATERRLDDERRMAVICCGGDSPVAVGDLQPGLVSQLDLLNRREIDSVYVITAVDAADDLKEYATGVRHLKVLRLDELLAAALDFGGYLQDLLDAFSTSPDGLPGYYIPPRTRDSRDLETVVRRWIEGKRDPEAPEPSQPIAVLGAYGMGKSSFSTHLAAVLARAAQHDPRARIPVLIRLGDLASEQSLEGLLGKQFTANYQVPGYSFAAFQELNRAGRFVIILDGFDEMKQLLSWSDFEYNLAQLYRLHIGNSRLIVLGRPTAFETDEEHKMALHAGGGRAMAGWIGEGWPDCFEIELSPFNNDEIRTFLDRYVRYRRPDLLDSEVALESLWEKVGSRHLRDVARRPVQLRMLAEILPDYGGEIGDLDLARIYDIFIGHLIDTVIKREDAKHSRAAFDLAERRDFLAALAFWLWKEQKATFVESETVPLELVEPYAKGRDPLAVRRDLFAGSPLDRRIGERFGFPHRSFQEFLVAETIWDRLRTGRMSVADADPLVTHEVSSFMALQRGRREIDAATRLVRTLQGTKLSWRLVSAVFLSEEVIRTIHERVNTRLSARTSRRSQVPITPWELLLMATWTMKNAQSRIFISLQDIVKLAQKENQSTFTLMALFCVLRLGGTPRRVEEAFHKLAAMLAAGDQPETVRWALVTEGQAVPAGDYVILRSAQGGWRVGRCVGDARVEMDRNGKPILVGAKQLQVRWLPAAAAHLALRLDIGRTGRTINVRSMQQSLRPVFGKWLPAAGFISDWLTPNGGLAADVRLSDDMGTTPTARSQLLDLFEPIRDACAAMNLDVRDIESSVSSAVQT